MRYYYQCTELDGIFFVIPEAGQNNWWQIFDRNVPNPPEKCETAIALCATRTYAKKICALLNNDEVRKRKDHAT